MEPTVVELPKKDSVPTFAFALPKLADSKVSSQPATKSKTQEPDKKSPQQTTEAESTKQDPVKIEASLIDVIEPKDKPTAAPVNPFMNAAASTTTNPFLNPSAQAQQVSNPFAQPQ